MERIILLLLVALLASCKQMKRCECEMPAGVSPYEFSTEIYYETPKKAEQLCSEREVGKEWECHIAN